MDWFTKRLPKEPHGAIANLPERSAKMAGKLRLGWWRRTESLLAALILAAVPVAIGVAGPTFSSAAGLVLGLPAGLASLQFFRRFFTGRPVVEWDEHGLVDRSSYIAGPFALSWGQIERASPTQGGGVRLELNEAALHGQSVDVLRRVQLAVNRLRGFHGIVINLSLLGLDNRELARVLTGLANASEYQRIKDGGEGLPARLPAKVDALLERLDGLEKPNR